MARRDEVGSVNKKPVSKRKKPYILPELKRYRTFINFHTSGQLNQQPESSVSPSDVVVLHHVALLVLIPVTSAPCRVAPVRFALLKSASVRIDPLRNELLRFAPLKFASVRNAPKRSAPLKFAPVRLIPFMTAFSKVAPLRSVPLRSAFSKSHFLQDPVFCN